MSTDAVAITSLILYGIGLIVNCLWFGRETYLNFAHKRGGKKGKRISYSKQVIASNIFILYVLVVANIALILDQGFFMREVGITIWWPRFVSYALCFAAVAYALSSFAWVYVKNKFVTVISCFAFWVVAGIIGSFTGQKDYQWIYFAVAFVPLAFAFFIWCWCKNRVLDKVTNGFTLSLFILFVGYGTVWGLSPAGGDTISIEAAFWSYFALEVLTFILYLPCLNCYYISKKYAVFKPELPKNNHHQNTETLHVTTGGFSQSYSNNNMNGATFVKY